MRVPGLARREAMVQAWNSSHTQGIDVVVRLDNGTDKQTKTRSAAWLLGGHTPVILLDGVSGCYALERVTALENPKEAA